MSNPTPRARRALLATVVVAAASSSATRALAGVHLRDGPVRPGAEGLATTTCRPSSVVHVFFEDGTGTTTAAAVRSGGT